MALDHQDILFASLLGGKAVEAIPRFNAIQNELSKRVLPPIPFLSLKNKEEYKQTQSTLSDHLWNADPSNLENQFFPLSLKKIKETQSYTLPYEPIITITGKNNIVTRNIAKQGNIIGSIKERWSQEDYQITITGVLIGELLTGKSESCFPMKDFQKLRSYLTAPEALEVMCEPLQLLGINYLVIQDFTFPFTKGENVQAYEIKAISDFSHNLLITVNK